MPDFGIASNRGRRGTILYFPLLRGLAGTDVTGLRPEQAGKRVTEIVSSKA